MKCEKCGGPIFEGVEYCPYCNSKVNNTNEKNNLIVGRQDKLDVTLGDLIYMFLYLKMNHQ